MEQQALISAIALMCKFTDINISRDKKENCMEKIVNCAIIKDGKFSEKTLNECEKKWTKK